MRPPPVPRFDVAGQRLLEQYLGQRREPQSMSSLHRSSGASSVAPGAVTVASLWRSSAVVKRESTVWKDQCQFVDLTASAPVQKMQSAFVGAGSPTIASDPCVDVPELLSSSITTTIADTEISSDGASVASCNKGHSSRSFFVKQRSFRRIKHRRYRQRRMLARYFWMSVWRPVLSLQSKDISLRLEALYEDALRSSLPGESKLFVEVWTASRSKGGGRISLYWRLWGFPVLTFDQSEPALNIMLRPVQSLLRRWLQKKVIKVLLLSPPCTTFLPSFRKPVLRSTVNPWGRHGLSQKYDEMIDKGNAEARLALALLCESALCGVGAALRHPSRSFLLRTPEIHTATTKFGFLQHEFHQCLYYGATLKRTTFLATSSCSWVYSIGGLCSNASGKCDRTGRRHRRMSALRPIKGVIFSDSMAKDIASFSALADVPL